MTEKKLKKANSLHQEIESHKFIKAKILSNITELFMDAYIHYDGDTKVELDPEIQDEVIELINQHYDEVIPDLEKKFAKL